jgi:putative hemolysin
VGITLVATLASAVGGLEAARWLGPQISRIPALAAYADQIALGLVVLTITYASLLFGELVPKRLAIRNPERFATGIAGFFEFLTRLVKWPIRVLLASADFVLGLLGAADSVDEIISPEEIEILVHRSAAEGVILPIQEQMIERIFDYADRSTRDEMTPRTEIISLDADTSIKPALKIAKKHGFSRYPVINGNVDRILGYVHIKDLIWADREDRLTEHLRPVVYIPEGVSLPKAFTTLTRAGRQLGIVLDEYGGTEGLITLENILEVIVGEIEDEHSPVAEVPEQSADCEWRITGGEAIAKVGDLLGIEFEPNEVYNTLGGFIIAELGRFPKPGDAVRHTGYCFVVEEMDRFRVISVRVYCIQSTPFE